MRSSAAKKEPRRGGVRIIGRADMAFLCSYAASLRSFRATFYFKVDLLTFGQGLEAGALDSAEMYENVCAAIVLRNKTETFGFVKPLDCTCSHKTIYL